MTTSEKKLKGQLCWLCGNENNLTLHHLNSPETKPKEKREDLGIILFGGECIPLCRTCHVKIEFLKQKRDTLKEIASGLARAKQGISALIKEEFYYASEEEKIK
jgi:hypothetical protein